MANTEKNAMSNANGPVPLKILAFPLKAEAPNCIFSIIWGEGCLLRSYPQFLSGGGK
jgi:hypothetical protein